MSVSLGRPVDRIHASLAYVGPRPMVGAAMAESLAALLARLGLPVEKQVTNGTSGLSLKTAGPEIVVLANDRPLGADLVARLERPEGPSAPRVERRLVQHGAHLTLRIADMPMHSRVQLAPPQRAALAQRLLRHLMTFAPADLVIWHPTQAVVTPEEFRLFGLSFGESRRSRQLPPITDDLSDGIAARGPETTAIANSEPDLAARLTDGNEKLRAIFRAVGDKARPHPRPRRTIERVAAEPGSSTAEKLSVYVMNGTILVLNFPVGMGMLTYNVLKGGDLTATARTMAITGTVLGLLGSMPAGLIPGI